MAISYSQLQQILSGYPMIELALLFGSQASGEATPDSDIDLALLCDIPLTSELKLELMGKLGEVFGRAVDIVDLHNAPEPVLGQALKGRRLIGDDGRYAQLLTRHVLNNADFVPLRERILTERREAWIN